ncbi:hypothetical protein C0991_012504 [Blastosporella zonata]|nr:hypothetical protein C0991_012504 [Blastosporella zonata]
MASSSSPPFSSNEPFSSCTPPEPSSLSWSDGSKSTDSLPSAPDEYFTRRLSVLLGQVQAERLGGLDECAVEIDGDKETYDIGCDSQTLSPLVFASPTPAATNDKLGFKFRTIHRASSYLPSSQVQDNSEPPRKRPRILTRTSTHTRLRTQLARTPASLRRAASLRSLPDDEVTFTLPLKLNHPLHVHPEPTKPSLSPHASQYTVIKNDSNNALGPVPIIAPPLSTPEAPLSLPPGVARIKRFLVRERELRAGMGLGATGNEGRDWSIIGEELRGKCVKWFLEVVPPTSKDHTLSSSSKDEEHEHEHEHEQEDDWDITSLSSSSTSSISSTTSFPHIINPALRLPSSPASFTSPSSSSSSTTTFFSHSSSSSSASSTTTTTTASSPSTAQTQIQTQTQTQIQTATHQPQLQPEKRTRKHKNPNQNPKHNKYPSNLHDQLATSPETRFHAAYLFLRFFWAQGGASVGAVVDGSVEEEDCAKRGEEVQAEMEQWGLDLGLGGWTFGVELDEEGKIAHRDLLAALRFRIGDTPQGLLIELWDAVPALGRVLRCGFDEEGREGDGQLWNCVQRETWRALFGAVLEPDVLRFPLSLLTAAALLHGLTVVLARRYEDTTPWYLYELCCGPGPPATRKESKDRAETAVARVKEELGFFLEVEEVS